jgi:hypothetical protein
MSGVALATGPPGDKVVLGPEIDCTSFFTCNLTLAHVGAFVVTPPCVAMSISGGDSAFNEVVGVTGERAASAWHEKLVAD